MGAADFVAQIAGQHAPGRQHRGRDRHDDALDIEFARDLGGMQAGRAAKTQQRKFSGIDAAAQGHQPDAVGHLQVDHADRCRRRLRCRDRPSDAATRSTAASAAAAVERTRSAHEGGCVEIAEHDIGVGDGGGFAAIAVAGRARHRARAFRADPQGAAGIDRRDRAAAGRDAGDVEAAQRNALAGEHAVGGQRGAALRDQRDVGRGAAHVERHQIGNGEQVGAAPAAGNAAGGA